MGYLTHLFFPWGVVLQVLAVLHFIRRRPDTYWLFIVLLLGPLGALVYLFAEALPDAELLSQSLKVIPRRKRIRMLEISILDNPSAGNYEELGDLYMDDGKIRRAHDAYEKAIAGRSTALDCFYRRGLCALELGNPVAALPDLERTVAKDAGHDFHRAAGMLAHAYAQTGEPAKAEAMFRQAVDRSTLSETYLNFATFLAAQGRNAEARQWAQKVLDKKPTMPGYLRRRERPWFRRAGAILKRVAA
jgi:hypothetical protein